jgi:hypothetical protein
MGLTKAHNRMIIESHTDVKDYGAVGDGVTDDTAAIQAALNEGGDVLFSNGQFLVSTLNINNDVKMIGSNSTLIHKDATNASIIKSLSDYKLVIENLDFTGGTQTIRFNYIWVSIGILEMYNCTIGSTFGHAIRTGNIDNFDAAFFAHDIIIKDCTITQNTTDSYDCMRIERTRGALIENNVVYGGLSGIRTQLFCKDLVIKNNKVSYSRGDVGITVALSERLLIEGNECHHHFSHGIEVDAVVDCKVLNNYLHHNTKSGIHASEFGSSFFADSALYAGSIAEGYGTDYSAQVFASTPVPNLNTVYQGNVITDNLFPVRFIGLDSDVFVNNYVNNPSIDAAYAAQLSIEGGTINNTGNKIYDNTFVLGATDTYVIRLSGYQFDAEAVGNKIIGDKPLSAWTLKGSNDLNSANKYLFDNTLRSVLLSDTNDSTAKTGSAVTHTTTGNTTYPFSGIYASGARGKRMRVIARVASGTQTAYVAVNLYDSAGAYVVTILSETPITLTSAYQEFFFDVPANAAVGTNIKPQLRIPDSGVTVFMTEWNIYTTV